MHVFQRLLLGVATTVLMMSGSLSIGSASSDSVNSGKVLAEPIFNVRNEIAELSGAVLDRGGLHAWSIGDSGNPALHFNLARTRLSDFKTQTIKVEGAANYDWEAVVQAGSGNLWILDTGDNRARRTRVQAFELSISALLQDNVSSIRPLRTLSFSYEDGARDVEAALVVNEEIYLIEKKLKAGSVRVAAIDISTGAPSTQVAQSRPHLPSLPQITDASRDPSGRIHFLTYLGIYRCDACFSAKTALKPVRRGFLGQIEALMIPATERYWVGREDGQIFVWK